MCGWRREKFASRSATARANQRRAAEALGVRLFFGEKLCGRTRVGRRLQPDGSHAGGQDDQAIVALKNVHSLVSFYLVVGDIVCWLCASAMKRLSTVFQLLVVNNCEIIVCFVL